MKLEEIIGYVPYGLKIKCSITKAHTLFGVYKDGEKELWAVVNDPDEETNTSNVLFDDITPILFPLSALTQEITVNGKTFVPMVELAKVVYPTRQWEMMRDCALSDRNDEFYLCHRNFVLYDEVAGHLDSMDQIALIQKCYSWKLDIHGLIDKGEAVSVFDLPKNPYEK